MTLPVVRTRRALRETVAGWKAAGESVGVVPTMGALHDGHLSLVEAARGGCDRAVVTLFVNPTQFNNPDDLKTYPRTEADDIAKLAPLGPHLLYAPGDGEIYPEGFSTSVTVSGISTALEGTHRPGHFDGVATVVTKLLLQTGADRAYFGQKDYQQLLMVRRMVRDLDIPAEIVGCPTVREADGLAMSSRNMRLSEAARAVAPALNREMRRAAQALAAGGDAAAVLETAKAAVVAAGFEQVEYMELRDAADLAPLARPDRPARLLAAAWLDGVRLIDNIEVSPG